jgi:uncharacterized protein YeaO (DUF488 family)
MQVKIKRVYEEAETEDGLRILVDRLWPRGLTKVRAKVDLWMPAVAPSTELRKWFDHDPLKWEAFQKRYDEELKHEPDAVEKLLDELRKGPATLLYGAKDAHINHALVLQEFVKKKAKP